MPKISISKMISPKSLPRRPRLFFGRRLILAKFGKIVCLGGLLMLADWLVYSRLSSWFIVEEDGEYRPQEVQPGMFKRITISSGFGGWRKKHKKYQDELIANMSTPLRVMEKMPTRHDDGDGGQKSKEFEYQKLICKKKVLIQGSRSRFRICYPPTILQQVVQKNGGLAYFINGPRDTEFESGFKKAANSTQLKVFTRHDNKAPMAPEKYGPDLVEDVEVKIYVDAGDPSEQDRTNKKVIGIKDLIDSHDDYHLMEFIKYEMKNQTDPIIFSINIPIFASQLLLRLEHFSYNEFRYLIRRLAFSLYFPFAVIHDRQEDVLFVSLMHKYSFHKYSTKGIEKAKWRRENHHFEEL